MSETEWISGPIINRSLSKLCEYAPNLYDTLAKTHNLLHNLTAIIPYNDEGYKNTTRAMADIRKVLALARGESP